jgi:hypothetical protein
MVPQNVPVKKLFVNTEPPPTISPVAPPEADASPCLQGEKKQWITDLKLQMEMSAQAATTCRRIGRR